MTTKAHKAILDRELSKISARKTIEIASPLLQEIVNHATNAFIRCINLPEKKTDADKVPLAIFRHIIEMTDGIEVLVAECCAMPSMPLLRSSYESLLYLMYIFEDKSEYEKRAYCWYVAYLSQMLSAAKRLDPLTNEGKNTLNKIRKGRLSIDLDKLPVGLVEQAIKGNKTVLAKPHLKAITKEYNSIRPKNWYHCFGGPTNLECLSEHLGYSGGYDLLFRRWSRLQHGQDFSSCFTNVEKSELIVAKLREDDNLKQVIELAAAFQMNATTRVLKWFVPKENIRAWYLESIDPSLKKLGIGPSSSKS